MVSPGYFRTLDMRLVRGRDFTDADTAGGAAVAIVNEAMARLRLEHARRARTDDRGERRSVGTWQPVTIVGVAADAQVITLGGTVEPYIYVPVAQRYVPRVSLVVKTAGGTAIPQVRALLREMNPNLPVAQALPLTEVTALRLIPQRIAAGVAGSLGVVGLLLAAIGIYGVTSYSVSRRVREIGIRVALGADGHTVLRLVLRQGIVLTLIGVGIGLAAGAARVAGAASRCCSASARSIRSPSAGAPRLFVAVALAASYFPARRATRVDPMVALRAE